MCGIFGYVGNHTSPQLFIESLRRLEYRGYDSWGIGLAGNGPLAVHKDVGRISNALMEDIPVQKGPFWGGISHTRWATHGSPNMQNAHPHIAREGKLAIVHNGIIENYVALKEQLQEKGHHLGSETDSEVIVHWISEFIDSGMSFQEAFLSTLKLLEGAYGVVAIDSESPNELLIARKGSPMVVGVGDGEMMVASDPAAIVSYTNRVIYLDDGDAAILHADNYQTHDINATPVNKTVQKITFDLPAIERGGYEHFMLKEIHEQPETIHNAFRGRIIRREGTAKLGGVDNELLRSIKRCRILACGTSWHAGLVGKYLIEHFARIPTEVHYAAEFRYADPVLENDTLVVAISQSGETADTLAGIREAKLQNASTMGICNVVGSTIARECGQGVYLHAGPEIGVASTKAFTSQLVVLSLLAVHLGRIRGMPLHDAIRFLDAMEKLPDQAEKLLECNTQIRELAELYKESSNFLYIGRLFEYPLALEGALKLKEISYIHAEGIPAAELKHGPIALIDQDMPTVVLATQESILDKMVSNVEEIRARGGKIIALAREGNTSIDRLSEHTIFIPPTLDPLVPILAAVPLQLLAYHIAVLRGCDVDHPRNLAKSVTVE
jgi:glucosamine--fructose-6-phosphate aminotransferase (isomerizing)